MSVGGYIRRKLFWQKNREMYHDYCEIKYINSEKSSATQALIDKKINNLLSHAVSTTKFYSNYNKSDLNSFPVINKHTVIDNRNDMFSNKYLGKKLHEMQTSGSTGIPFVIQQDYYKRKRVITEIKAMNDYAGYPSHEKMLYIWGAARKKEYPRIQEFRENIYRIGVAVNDEKSMKKIVDFIITKKPVALHASASNLPPIIDYIKKYSISPKKFKIKTIITGGEMVPEKLRYDLQAVFGEQCRVIVKYSNEEMGILAQDNGVSTPYILNVANYYFEILKLDSDEPCKFGELGRIVITDLYNYAVPLIRYDTGDMGILRQDDQKHWPCLVNLSGKRRDLLFTTSGDSISGATMTNLLKQIKNVKQWQIIQETKNTYRYKIVPEKNTHPTENDILLYDLQSLFGSNSNIIVECVDEIPVLDSGKRRYTVNLYQPQ